MPSPRPTSRRPSAPRPAWEGTRRWLFVSRLFLVWERLCAAFWPLASVLGGLLALALAGLPSLIPAWAHALVLMLGAALVLATTGTGVRRFRWPSRHDARRRLEAGATERVLTAATDRLALGGADPLARALWARHRRRARAAAARLRPRPPDPVVAARDPRALRFIPILLLVVGVVLGAQDPGARLLAFVSPRLGSGEDLPIARVWLTPPDYTGLPPVTLETGRPDTGQDEAPALRVPKGTAVLALVHGRAESARLTVGGEEQGMEVLDPHSLRASLVVKSDGALSVRADGHTLLHRGLEVLPDDPPSVRFAAAPGSDPRGRLVLTLAARDDHGVVGLGVDLRPLAPRRNDPEGALTLDFPAPEAQARDVINRATPDLTAHRWAGREVRLTPWAVDALGQRAQGESVTLTLPRRVFRHPVARALIGERERLTEDPGALPGVISRLDSLTARPEAFDHTLSVYLALRVARSHLAGHGRSAEIDRVRDLLWDAAVRVEEGDGARVVADLEALRERVQEALSGSLSQDDLDRLVREAREALTQALADLQRSLDALDPEGTLQRDLGQDDDAVDLDQLLRDLQDMNRLGARDATRTLLEHLSDALAALQPQRLTPEALQTLRQTLEQSRALAALRREQAALLDDTFRAEQTHQPRVEPPGTQGLDTRLGELRRGDRLPLPSAKAPPRPEGQSRPLAQRQQDVQGRLEQILRDIAEKTDQVPPALGEAALAMGEAVEHLKTGDLAAAQENQRTALERLSEGQAQARSQMRRALGLPLMPRLGQRGPGFDPLGREQGGLGPGTDTVGMPDRSEARRARDILEELRRRANDPNRSAPEKAYIDRLIPRF